MEFEDHLWLPFLDQPQSDILIFEIINFYIYNSLVTKWKHGIGHNDIISFNEELKVISTSTIELVDIDESSHEESIIISITNKGLNMTKTILL